MRYNGGLRGKFTEIQLDWILQNMWRFQDEAWRTRFRTTHSWKTEFFEKTIHDYKLDGSNNRLQWSDHPTQETWPPKTLIRETFTFLLHASLSYQSFPRSCLLRRMVGSLQSVITSIKLIIVDCFFKELRFSAVCCTKSCPPSLVLESSHVLKNSVQLYFSELSTKASVVPHQVVTQ
jgi:hypothetical protein